MRYHHSTLTRRVAILIALSAGAVVRVQAAITVNPFPATPTVTPFPHDTPPPDMGDAAADQTTGVSVAYNYTTGGTPPAVTVTSLTGTVDGTSEIRIPDDHNNPADPLYKHELTHHRLSKFEYDKVAGPKAAAASKKVTSGSYATAAAAQAAVDSAMAALQASISSQIDTLNTSFDTMTAHGTKDTPTADDAYNTITTAKDQAAAKTAPATPQAGQVISSVGDPPAVQFVSGKLRFTGDLAIDGTKNAVDPLRGYGTFAIADMIPIGLNPDGTVLLSDATCSIVSPTGGVLVGGALFDVHYGASTLPGYAGMLQASYWVLPAEWGGVNNAIGSAALGEFASLSNARELLTFWFFANDPLFTAGGDPAFERTPASVSGTIKIVPTPGTVLTLALGLGLVAWHRRGRPA